jgi:hypothetical protein
MLQVKKHLRIWAGAVLLAALAGTAQADTSHQEFAAALQKWQAAGIHDYSFTLFQSCECLYREAIRITVQGDRVRSATNAEGGAAVRPSEVGMPLTMTEIFQKIEAAYARPADHIKLRLNKDYGYPERVFIDYIAMMADDELIYDISEFTH